jgi:hypothetical protein
MQFSKATILKYRDYLSLQKKLAPKSINLHLTVLRRLAQEAMDEGVIDSDRLRPAFSGFRWFPIVGCGLACGCRVNRRSAS